MSSPSKVEPAGLDREALERERTRLEGLLALDEAWRALKQLEERLARGEATSAVAADALKASLGRELASNRLYSVYRDVLAKLAGPVASPVAEGKGASSAAEASAFRTKITVKPAGVPSGAEQRTEAPTGEDDLTRIRGLTRPMAERLKSLGISRFETIASWTRADVDRISIALGLGRAIVRQSWVDQAAILVQSRAAREGSRAAPAPAAVTPDVRPTATEPAVPAAPRPPLPQPPAPPPQAVLGTLLTRRLDQPVNEPLLSLQRPRAGLVSAAVPPTDGTPSAKSSPVMPVASAAQPPAGPISAAALAAAIAASRSVAAPQAPAAPAVMATRALPAAPPAPAVTVPALEPSPYDCRVDLIDGLGSEAVAALAAKGVTRAGQIAAFKAEDVRRWGRDLGTGLRAPFTHVIEQAAMLANGQPPAAARMKLGGRIGSLVPYPTPLDWGQPLLLDRLRREAEEAAKPKTPEEADRIARRSLREALAAGDPGRAAFAATMTTARTRLVDRLALIDLPRRPRGSSDDVVAAFEERMAALQRDLDEMERRLRADPVPRVGPDAGSTASAIETPKPDAVTPAVVADAAPAPAAPGDAIAAAETGPTASIAVDTIPAATPNSPSAPAPSPTQPAASPQTPATAQAARSTEPMTVTAAAKQTATVKPAAEPVSEPAAARPVNEMAARPAAPAAAVAASTSRTPDAEAKDVEPEPLLGLGEADVVIVAKTPPARAADVAAAAPSPPPAVSAESLAKRLRRFGNAEPIEAEGYAAYHGEVEEAAVEIVRAPRPASPPKGAGNGAAAPKAATGDRNSAIKRFVRALSGGP